MKNNKFLIILFLLLVMILKGKEQEEVNLLRWVGPSDTKPNTFKEWILDNPYTDLSIVFHSKSSPGIEGKEIAVLTEQNIALSIQDEINQFIKNLEIDGFSVLSYIISGGTPENLKMFLKSLYSKDSIVGAIFIGNLPVAWFQVKNDFYTYGYAEWPIDLFYMDLDGNWIDSLKFDTIDTLVPGSDSIYDKHSGNVVPEIYIGRLMPTGIGDDTIIIKNYFYKNNSYRNGSMKLPNRALVYVDDDWQYWATEWASDVALLYEDTLLVSHPETTKAYDYRIRLDTARAWVSVFAHSWPGGHQFKFNNGSSYDYYYSYEYTNQIPPANFYNHFACSFARYTTDGYGGGRSIFNESYGLGAIGSTKTGSMLEFSHFYQSLADGRTLGDAFKDWFIYIVEDSVTFNELCWHYGMTLLGDPFIRPRGSASAIKDIYSDKESNFKILNVIEVSRRNIKLQYDVNGSLFIDIKLYDISGRFLRMLYSGIVNPTENYFLFNVSDLRSGIYFIKLENNNDKIVEKIIIM